MRAGQLGTPLWIQVPIETVRADNHREVTGFTTLTKWWGRRLGARSSQVVAAQQRHGGRAVVFSGRFLPSLTVTSRMVLATADVTTLPGATRYDIQGADDEDGRQVELFITAIERGV